MRPTLLSSCALATTAREARYRIDAPIAGRRGARVIALDDGAATMVRRLARDSWNAAQFYTLATRRPDDDGPDPVTGDPDVPLRTTGGGATRLSSELVDADVVVMVATAAAGHAGRGAPTEASTMSSIGDACGWRGIMTAAVVVGDQTTASAALHALRPHARVLLVSSDGEDAAEILTAIRA
jgi:hypothetical protein